MVRRGDYLIEARSALDDTGRASRYRLTTATKLFWRAYMFQGSDWWPETRRAAGWLLNDLFAQGRSGKTIAEMDEATVERLIRDLRALIEKCENE